VVVNTPEPPYTAVIFTSVRTPEETGYDEATAQMVALAAEQPGFLGMESARAALGITVSYWENDEAARAWKRVAEHAVIQRRGRAEWYAAYQVRVATVTREYGHESGPGRR